MSLAYSIKNGTIMGPGNVHGMAETIREICAKGKDYYTETCRKRAGGSLIRTCASRSTLSCMRG